MFGSKCFKSQLQVEIHSRDKVILLENTTTCKNQFYVSRVTFIFHKSESKHAQN